MIFNMLVFFLPVLFLSLHAALAALPQVDFDRMGKVGLAGNFAGLDLFSSSTSTTTLDPSTSTLFSRSSDGALSRLASTNSGGRILAGCALADVFYFAGSFSSIGSTSAANIASYTPSSGSFAALASSGPNGQVDSIFCDQNNNKVWVGGRFTSPASAVAVWDTKSNSWSKPPFSGLAGAEGRVLSITSNSSRSSLFFAGSFITSFGGNSSTFNGTNNPNVPYSPGATPFTSSLVPVPLGNSQVDGGPSSSDPQFSSIQNILCPSGPDGPGNTWFAADGIEALITIRKFQSISASGVRLGNTFLQGRGATTFSLTTIPDNAVRPLTYVDPASGQNQSCTQCPLSTDSSVLYQDFLFSSTLGVTGIQVKLSEWTGPGPGLHILQLLSSGAFASALGDDNGQSCFAPNSSTTSFTGNWTNKVADTNIAGTTQSTLTALVDVGTPAAQAPSFTWMPYVSASGTYIVNILVPGCTNFQDCGLRTSVKVTVFPGQGIDPWVSTISQQNTEDAVLTVYAGPIVPSSPNFVTTLEMTLADSPAGTGQGGKYEMVADRVQLILTSVNGSSSVNSSSNGPGSGGNGRNAFGFFEWPLSTTSTVDGTKSLPNSTETSLDKIGFSLFSAAGASSLTTSSTTAIVAVVHHPSGIIYLGGNFTLSSGTASGSANIVAFKNGALAALPGGGLNGPVSSLVLAGNRLFVGGSFTDTNTPSSQGKLRGVAIYDVSQNQWVAMQAGVNGAVTSLGYSIGRIQVAGSFTTVLDTATGTSGVVTNGFATWDVNTSQWVNSGGFLVGSVTFVGNGSTPSKGQQQSQFVAGNVLSSRQFGANGLVMLQNGGSDEPEVTPLGVQLENGVTAPTGTNTKRRRSHVRRGPVTWIPRISNLFSRQTTSQLVPLPDSQPALAPSVLAGAFWTNISTSHELVIIGGNFSFTPFSGAAEASAVGLYDTTSTTITALQGSQLNGTVRSLLVQNNMLYIGGEFSLPGTTTDGFAIYDLAKQQWAVSNLQALQGDSSETTVVVRSVTASPAKPNTVIVAGSFAQAGSLRCQSICSLDIQSLQWNTLGNGIQGEVAAVDYAGDTQDTLIASGSLALSDNTISNVAKYYFTNATWSAIGANPELPGPVTALAINNRNASSIFAAGRSYDGSSPYLSFWNGASWTQLGTTLQATTNVSQLTMVPLQDTHAANGVVEPDRMLMVSGLLSDSSFGNASSALFDGHTFVPYIVSTSSAGTPGFVSSLFHSFSTFSFGQHHFLATGIVILISIAIAAGVVFVLALIGILWTLFSRRDESLNKLGTADLNDDDDSAQHRPSSLLEHINAATRTTILGVNNPFVSEKDEKAATAGGAAVNDPDASNYVRAETPSDAVGGILAGDEASRPAFARYSFDGAGEGELPLSVGMEVEVLDDRDAAWWYARDSRTGKEGVVPAAYLY